MRMFPMVMAQLSSGGIAICYVFTSSFVDDVTFSRDDPMA